MWSKRNYLYYSEKNGPMLYVGNSNSLIHLDNLVFEKIRNYLFENIPLPQNIDKELRDIGAIVESDESINNLQLYISRKTEIISGQLTIWLSLTDFCNFNCSYCFEKKSPSVLDEKKVDKIIEFIKKHKGIESVHFSLYGGEPLLNAKIIPYLDSEMKKLNLKTITYFLVTNGYLLSCEMVESFSKIKNFTYQITLDGLEKTHNSRRPHKSAFDSFERIMNNLECIYNKYRDYTNKPIIRLRVNVDKRNCNEFHQLYLALKEKYNSFFDIYSSPVLDYCYGIDTTPYLFTPEEYSYFLVQNFKMYGIYEDHFPTSNFSGNGCGASCYRFYCIGSDCKVYRCPSDLGDEKLAILDLNNPLFTNNNPTINYSIEADPFCINTCKDCFLLYPCKGSCRKKLYMAEKNLSIKLCHPYKFYTNEHLDMYYENQKKHPKV